MLEFEGVYCPPCIEHNIHNSQQLAFITQCKNFTLLQKKNLNRSWESMIDLDLLHLQINLILMLYPAKIRYGKLVWFLKTHKLKVPTMDIEIERSGF